MILYKLAIWYPARSAGHHAKMFVNGEAIRRADKEDVLHSEA